VCCSKVPLKYLRTSEVLPAPADPKTMHFRGMEGALFREGSVDNFMARGCFCGETGVVCVMVGSG
jgi:hypothetical protein